jgi:hypothetical protein
MKTNKEVLAEIAKLKEIKPLIPERTAFGDSNWDKIDASIKVLEEDLSSEEIYNNTQEETLSEEENESREWTFDVGREAIAARYWMDGDSEEKPSDGWKDLIGVKPQYNFSGLSPKHALATIHADLYCNKGSKKAPRKAPKKNKAK